MKLLIHLIFVLLCCNSTAHTPKYDHSICIHQISYQRLHHRGIISASSTARKSKVEETIDYLGKTIKRLSSGVTQIIPNGLRVLEIRKAYKSDPTSVSYLDWKRIGQFSDDLSKLVRLAITIPLSPELFFYSYIVAPVLSPNNPFAWMSLPSTFDTSEDKLKREEICVLRRLHAVSNGLQALRRHVIEDLNADTRHVKQEHLQLAISAMHTASSSSIGKALEILSPWIQTEKAEKKPATAVRLTRVAGGIVKDFCRSLGVDGVPNIPLLRRLNNGEVNRYCQKLAESDSFIRTVGVSSLDQRELEEACLERFFLARKDVRVMRAELSEWIHLTTDDVSGDTPSTGLVVNPQSRRLALLALNAARELKAASRTNSPSIAANKLFQMY